jgi:polysaccharide deacetylase 2 family uncharacterized protein YibQ
MNGKKSPSRGTKKRKKLSARDLRINLIILGAIAGISLTFFVVRLALTPAASPAPTPVELPPPAVSMAPEEALPAPNNEAATLSAPAAPDPESAQPGASAAVPENPSNSVGVSAPAAAPSPEVPAAAVAPSVKVSPQKSISVKTPAVKTPAEKTSPVAAPVAKAPVSKAPVAKSPEAVSTLSLAGPSGQKPVKPVPPKHRATIIFVFDDAGYNLKQLDAFLSLPFPCTIAVLPGLQYSEEAARRIRAAGKDVILHQPMQANNLKMDPGPGAITKGMTQDQIRAIVRKNLAEVWPVVGLNNHEGSLMTADRAAMNAVLDVVREKRIYFLDSRTDARTVAPELARERGMTIWERSVFLDNTQDRVSIIEAVNNGLKVADKKGTAIMIGHIWSNQLAGILSDMYPELVSQGFSLSTIAQVAMSEEFGE